MMLRLMEGLLVGIFLFAFFYYGTMGLLAFYFFESGYLYNAEIPRINELQRQIDEEGWSLKDTDELVRWADERRISDFLIYQNEELIFDIAKESEEYIENHYSNSLMSSYLYDVTFPEGPVQVYLYEGAGTNYYRLLMFLSFLAGFGAYLGVFLSGLKEDVMYIQTLRNEVDTFTSGDLTHPVTISGENELTQLAAGLDQMRRSLLEKDAKEHEMRAAQKKMVLGMSHDLKTPLTGLIAYMEILKRQQESGSVSSEYLEKAYNQILQMRNLSNRMFEYFLIDSREVLELEEPEEAESVLGDYLSEFCALLASIGFHCDTERIAWKDHVKIRVNTDYMGRIMNNLVSNLEKYADRSQPVSLLIQYESDSLCLVIRNAIQIPNPYVEGTGIGTKNVAMMMRQMGGSQEIVMTAQTFITRLYFLIAS